MEAFIRKKGVTYLPGMGTPELAVMNKKREKDMEGMNWLQRNRKRKRGKS